MASERLKAMVTKMKQFLSGQWSPSLFMRCPPSVDEEELLYYNNLFSNNRKKRRMSVSVAQRQYVFPSFTMRGMDGLRRKESDGKRAQALCPADATNIEIEITSLASQPFQIVVKTPQGEKGELHFSEMSSSQNFTPETHTCGHGVWSVEVYKLLDSGRTLVSRTENELNGVGTLFYTVDENLEINLHGTNFLLCKGACPLTH